MTKKNIFFTGCSSSFGSLVREHLTAQGHQVYGVGLKGPDVEIDFVRTSEGYLEHIWNDAVKKIGPIDVLINNAGITKIDFLQNHSFSDFHDVLHVNLSVPFIFSRCLARDVEKDPTRYSREDPARIINTSSMGATITLRASPGYCASKGGLEAMTKSLAKEFAQKLPIITCAIAPGGVDNTGMVVQAIADLQRTRGMTAEEAERYNRQSPLGRNMHHEELWHIFDFAVNTMPEYMSGTILKCSGAMGV